MSAHVPAVTYIRPPHDLACQRLKKSNEEIYLELEGRLYL